MSVRPLESMQIDHVGYAVKDIDRAKKSFETLGFQFGKSINDPERNIKILFGEKDGYRIELVQPLNKKKPSPVDVYLDKMGATPYHFCYVSDSFIEDIVDLKNKGFRVVLDSQPAVAFNGRKVVFMMNLGMGLIEIVEKGSDDHD